MGKFSHSIIFTVASKGARILINILTTIIIANGIGPNGQGEYKLAILFSGMLVAFGNLGITQSMIYFYNKAKEDVDRSYVVYTTFGFSVLVASLLVMVGLVIVIFFRNSVFPNVSSIVLILGAISAPFLFLNSVIGSVFLAQKNSKLYNITGVLNLVFFLVSLLVVYSFWTLTSANVVYCYSLTSVFSFIYLLTIFRKRGNKIRVIFDIKYNLLMARYGIKIFMSSLMNFFHYRVDAFVINLLLAPASVGIYSIAATLSEKSWIVSQSVGEMLFPKVASEKNSTNSINFTILIFKLVMVFTILFSLLLIILSGPLIKILFSPEYVNSIIPFRILLIGTIFMGGWRVLINDLYGRGIISPSIFASVISVILNILLNLVLVKRIGIQGAAIASTLTYTFTLLATIYIFCSKLNVNVLRFVTISNDETTYVKLLIMKKISSLFK